MRNVLAIAILLGSAHVACADDIPGRELYRKNLMDCIAHAPACRENLLTAQDREFVAFEPRGQRLSPELLAELADARMGIGASTIPRGERVAVPEGKPPATVSAPAVWGALAAFFCVVLGVGGLLSLAPRRRARPRPAAAPARRESRPPPADLDEALDRLRMPALRDFFVPFGTGAVPVDAAVLVRDGIVILHSEHGPEMFSGRADAPRWERSSGGTRKRVVNPMILARASASAVSGCLRAPFGVDAMVVLSGGACLREPVEDCVTPEELMRRLLPRSGRASEELAEAWDRLSGLASRNQDDLRHLHAVQTRRTDVRI